MMWIIMQISEDVITSAASVDNILLDLHNSLHPTHLIIVNDNNNNNGNFFVFLTVQL